MHQCPACQRSFGEPGFCPYDGSRLNEQPASGNPTVLSSFVEAQPDPRTEPEHDTVSGEHATQLGVDPPTASKVRAISAATGERQAIKDFYEGQESEYDHLVGETLDGRYFVQRKIGEGGMGVVFAAKHAVIERPLAIKVLKREVMRDQGTIRRFVQEAKAASRIGHPNIVDVTDFGTTPEGMTYSVMEYVDGITLSRAIKHAAPFTPERAIRVALQIARALGAAHDKGIVHRDLKPENVFLIDRDARPDFVKIVDFGIAKVQPMDGAASGPRLTKAGSVFGTPEYMAPEQAAGRSDTDQRVDVYALGTILYEMVTGRTPHKSDSMVRTIAMQIIEPIVPPSQLMPELAVPRALETVIMKALEKKREDRYQSMAEFSIGLDAAAKMLPAPAPSSSLAPLPPGADPGITPSLPPAKLQSPRAAPDAPTMQDSAATTPTTTGDASASGPPRRAKPLTRQHHEPEFASHKPRRLQVYDDAPEDQPRSRRPLAALGLVLAGGAASALYLGVLRGRGDAPTTHDAAMIAIARDASALAIRDDAEPAPDDATAVVDVPNDGGRRSHGADGGATIAIGSDGPHPDTFEIEVLTKPAEANVFVGKTYRGPSGVRLRERWGTTLKIECRAPHFKGSKTIKFDGSLTAVMCNATRIKLCTPGIKNPFDDCEKASGSGPASPIDDPLGKPSSQPISKPEELPTPSGPITRPR